MASGMTHKNIINSWVTVIIILYKLLTWAMAECVTVFPDIERKLCYARSGLGPGEPGLVTANWWKRTRVLSRAESGPGSGSGDPPSLSEIRERDGATDTRMWDVRCETGDIVSRKWPTFWQIVVIFVEVLCTRFYDLIHWEIASLFFHSMFVLQQRMRNIWVNLETVNIILDRRASSESL